MLSLLLLLLSLLVLFPASGECSLLIDLPLDSSTNDESGNNLHSTGTVNAASLVDSSRGPCFTLTAVTSSITLPSSTLLQFTGSFSYSVWAKADSANSIWFNGAVLNFLGAGTGWALRFNPPNQAINEFNTVTRTVATNNWSDLFCGSSPTTTVFTAGQWFHLAVVHGTSSTTMYVNGVQVCSHAQALVPIVPNTGTSAIGASAGYTSFIGRVGFFRLWDNTLTAAQVAAEYGATIEFCSGEGLLGAGAVGGGGGRTHSASTNKCYVWIYVDDGLTPLARARAACQALPNTDIVEFTSAADETEAAAALVPTGNDRFTWIGHTCTTSCTPYPPTTVTGSVTATTRAPTLYSSVHMPHYRSGTAMMLFTPAPGASVNVAAMGGTASAPDPIYSGYSANYVLDGDYTAVSGSSYFAWAPLFTTATTYLYVTLANAHAINAADIIFPQNVMWSSGTAGSLTPAAGACTLVGCQDMLIEYYNEVTATWLTFGTKTGNTNVCIHQITGLVFAKDFRFSCTFKGAYLNAEVEEFRLWTAPTTSYLTSREPTSIPAERVGVMCVRSPGSPTLASLTPASLTSGGTTTVTLSFSLPYDIPIGPSDVFVLTVNSPALYDLTLSGGMTADFVGSAVPMSGSLSVAIASPSIELYRAPPYNYIIRGNRGVYSIRLVGVKLGSTPGTLSNAFTLGIMSGNTGKYTYTVAAFSPGNVVLGAVLSSVLGTPASVLGGSILTLVGTNFGPVSLWPPAASDIKVGTYNCPSSAGMFDSDTQVRCTVPAGVGLGLAVSYKVGLPTAVTLAAAFSYLAPTVSLVSPAASGDGSTYVTIYGAEFLSAASISSISVKVTPGGATVGCTSIADHVAGASVICKPGPGAGSGLDVRITVASQATAAANTLLSYLPPSVSAASPSPSTLGSGATSTITVYGSDFGSSTADIQAVKLTVGPAAATVACGTVAWITSTALSCLVPALSSGSGVDVLVTVGQIGPQGSGVSGAAVLTYKAPAITAMLASGGAVPANPVPSSDSLLTIYGTDFGSSYPGSTPARFVASSGTHPARPCQNPTLLAWNSVVCEIPAGVGNVWTAVITAGAVGPQASAASSVFSYAAPAVTAVGQSPTAGAVVDLWGSNLGGSFAGTWQDAYYKAQFGGSSSSGCTRVTSTHITCAAPAGVGSGATVTLTVDGPVASAGFSYVAPTLSAVSQPSTAGSSTITLYGLNLGHAVGVVPGVSFDSPVTQACATPTWLSATHVSCVMPAGAGRAIQIVVTVGNQVSSAPNTLLSYKAPVITAMVSGAGPATLPPLGTSPLPSYDSILTIYGTDFGPTDPLTAVSLSGGGPSGTPSKACLTPQSSYSVIMCTLPAGPGGGWTVTVTAGVGLPAVVQKATVGSVTYAAPTVTAVQTSAAAGQTITVYGTNFGGLAGGWDNSWYTVGFGPAYASACTSATRISDLQISCVTPPGQGAGLPFRVAVDTASGSHPTAFSYTGPTIASLAPNPHTRAQGELTLTGSNFGSAANTPTVSVGAGEFGGASMACAPATIISDTRIVCTLPAATENGRVVSATIAGVAVAVTAPALSFAAPTITAFAPATLPTAGGALTVFGTDFAHPLQTEVNLGAPSANSFLPHRCKVTAVAPTRDSAVCTLPDGVGAAKPVSVTIGPALGVYDASNVGVTTYPVTLPSGYTAVTLSSPLFSYDPPSITATANRAATLGGTGVTLLGSNFGVYVQANTGPAGKSLAAAAATGVCSATAWISDTAALCTAPPGDGAGLDVAITVGTQVSAGPLTVFSYKAPKLTAVVPPHGPTVGGFTVTLLGADFGPSGPWTATIGGTSCTAGLIVSDSQFTCTAPAGFFAARPVVIQVAGGQLSDSDLLSGPGALTYDLNIAAGEIVAGKTILFSYDPPVVTALSPATAPAPGSVTVTVLGSNFGAVEQNAYMPEVIKIGGTACAGVGWLSDSAMTCTVPEGLGKAVQVLVSITGRQNVPASAALFTYQPPTVTAVIASGPDVYTVGGPPAPVWLGGLYPTGSLVVRSPAAGGVFVTLVGSNFGAGYDHGGVTALVNAVPCANLFGLYWLSDSYALCKVPALPVFSGMATVAVTAGAQTGSSATLLAVYPHWDYAAANQTLAGPSAGGWNFTLPGFGFNTSDSGYRCVFTLGAYVAKSAPTRPASGTSFVCTTPEWLVAAPSVAAVTLEDGDGVPIEPQQGSGTVPAGAPYLTVTFWEDFDSIDPVVATPGADLSLSVFGGGFNTSQQYRCLLSNTATPNTTIYLASDPVFPAFPDLIVCPLPGATTFAWGQPLRPARVTLHIGPDLSPLQNLSLGFTAHTVTVPAAPGALNTLTFQLSAPAKPVGLTAAAVSPFSVSLTWPALSLKDWGGLPLLGYRLVRNLTSGGGAVFQNVSLSSPLATAATAAGDPATVAFAPCGGGAATPACGIPSGWSVWPETTYSFWLTAFSALGESVVSDALTVTTPPSPPIIAAVTPVAGPSAGYTVTLDGYEFGPSASPLYVTLSLGNLSLDATVLSRTPDRIVLRTPTVTTPGAYTLNVTCGNSVNALLLSSLSLEPAPTAPESRPVNSLRIVYNNPPNITAVTPAAVPRRSPGIPPATIVTIVGTDLGASAVDLASVVLPGPTPCLAVTWVSTTSCLCTAAVASAEAYGPVSVTTLAGGLSLGVAVFRYTVPWTLSVTPASGPYSGGDLVTIQGEDMGRSAADLISVEFASVSPTTQAVTVTQPCLDVIWVSPTLITCTTPDSLVVGSMAAVVTTRTGGAGPATRSSRPLALQAAVGPGSFAFLRANYTSAPPLVSAVVPSSGSLLGGETVTLYGTNLGASALDFDFSPAAKPGPATLAGVRCARVSWVSSSQVVCLTGALAPPWGSPDPAPVGVALVTTVSGGIGIAAKAKATFRYRWPVPVLSRVSPRVSPVLGAATVTLQGKWLLGFDTKPVVTMNGVACTQTRWLSDSLATCVVPPMSAFGSMYSPPQPAATPFAVTVVDQTSSPLSVPFAYGLSCAPECGWEGDCVPGRTASDPAVCQCRPFWTEPPGCAASVVRVAKANATAPAVTSEDGDTLALTISLAQAPAGPVIVFVNNSRPSEVKLSGGDQQRIEFTAADWSAPRTLVVTGVYDGLRDGDQPWELVFSVVSPLDAQFNGAPVPPFAGVNLEAAPVLESIDRALSSLAGSNRTLSGKNLDPLVSIEITPVVAAGAQPARSAGSQVWVLYESPAPARRTTFSASEYYPGSGSPPADPTRSYGRALARLPSAPAAGYYRLTLRNLGNGATGQAPVRSVAELPEPVFFTDDCPQQGMYGVGDACRPCPEGATCPGGNRLWPVEGYWNPGEDSGYVIRCDPPSSCLGGKDRVCAPGYSSRCPTCASETVVDPTQVCACCSCQRNFYKALDGTHLCVPCPSQKSTAVIVVANVALWVLITLSGWLLTYSEDLDNVTGFVLALQQIGALGCPSSSPSIMRAVFEVLYMFSGNVSFVKPDCVKPVPFHLKFATQVAYLFGVTAPMLLFMFAVTRFGVWRVRNKGAEAMIQRGKMLKARHSRLALVAATFSMMPIATISIQATFCRHLNIKGVGQWDLFAEPGYRCYKSKAHLACVGFAAIFGIGLVILLPIWYFRRISAPENRERLDFGDPVFKERWDLMCADYKPNRRWFLFNDLVVGLMIASSTTVLAQNPNSQVAIMAGVLAVSLLAIIAIRPYARPVDAVRQICLGLCNLLSVVYAYFVGGAYSSALPWLKLPATAVSAMGWSFFVIALLVIASFFFSLVRSLFWPSAYHSKLVGSPEHWMDAAVEIEGVKAVEADDLLGQVFGHGEVDLDELHALADQLGADRDREKREKAEREASERIRAAAFVPTAEAMDLKLGGVGLFFDADVDSNEDKAVLDDMGKFDVEQPQFAGASIGTTLTSMVDKAEGAALQLIDKMFQSKK